MVTSLAWVHLEPCGRGGSGGGGWVAEGGDSEVCRVSMHIPEQYGQGKPGPAAALRSPLLGSGLWNSGSRTSFSIPRVSFSPSCLCKTSPALSPYPAHHRPCPDPGNKLFWCYKEKSNPEERSRLKEAGRVPQQQAREAQRSPWTRGIKQPCPNPLT